MTRPEDTRPRDVEADHGYYRSMLDLDEEDRFYRTGRGVFAIIAGILIASAVFLVTVGYALIRWAA